MDLRAIIYISRPRFWLYIAGPYLVGYCFAIKNITELQSIFFLIHFLFFLIPANIFLYGVNDICDEDTDKHNDKKGEYEHRLLSDEKRLLTAFLFGSIGLAFVILSLQPKIESQLIFTLFLLLSFFYSAPPLRFKARPFLDFSSNILYVLPGILAYYQVRELFPSLVVIVALFCWTSAMHLFSAIPDIIADKKADLQTTAVILGQKNSLLLCTFLWAITAVITLLNIDSYLASLVVIYPLIPLIIVFQKNSNIKRIYKIFPYINTLAGFLLFLLAIS